jgi:hypothetical protein
MSYRGKDPRNTVTGGTTKTTTSKYRGAPKAGAAGFYKGRGYERPAAPAPATTGSYSAYTYDGYLLAALLAYLEAEEQAERQTQEQCLEIKYLSYDNSNCATSYVICDSRD